MSKKTVAKTPNPLMRVTLVSKLLAAALLIILPFVGAYLGYLYYPVMNNL